MGLFTKKAPPLKESDAKADPSPRAWSIVSGRSKSASIVTPTSAMKLGGVWRAVNHISGIVGTLPCKIYKDGKDGGKEVLKSDPRYRLVRRQAAPDISAANFRQTLTAHALLRGNGYGYIMRDATFQPVGMWPLDPDKTCAARDEQRNLWYLTQVDGKAYSIQPYNVLHIRGLGDNGITGHSVISYFAEEGGLATAARDFASLYFANGTNTGSVLKWPAALSETAFKRLKQSLAENNEGPANAHKHMILEEGGGFEKTGVPAKDAQLLESRKFSLVEIANWFGVPPHILGDSARTAYNSLSAENQSFLDNCLNPWLVRWEDEYAAKILTDEEYATESVQIEFVREALVRADITARGAYYQQAVGRPWMTPNEARRLENLPTIDGGEALLAPLNQAATPAATEPQKAKPPAEETPPDDEEETT